MKTFSNFETVCIVVTMLLFVIAAIASWRLDKVEKINKELQEDNLKLREELWNKNIILENIKSEKLKLENSVINLTNAKINQKRITNLSVPNEFERL